MTPAPIGIVPVLLLVGAAFVCLFSCAGLVAMKGFYNKLHYLAPPAILGTGAVAVAIVVQEGWSSSSIKALLVLLVMVVANPVLTHAAARAFYLRGQRNHEK